MATEIILAFFGIGALLALLTVIGMGLEALGLRSGAVLWHLASVPWMALWLLLLLYAEVVSNSRRALWFWSRQVHLWRNRRRRGHGAEEDLNLPVYIRPSWVGLFWNEGNLLLNAAGRDVEEEEDLRTLAKIRALRAAMRPEFYR